jgi:hypothetical protein
MLKGGGISGDPAVDGRMILKWILENQVWRVWNVFV